MFYLIIIWGWRHGALHMYCMVLKNAFPGSKKHISGLAASIYTKQTYLIQRQNDLALFTTISQLKSNKLKLSWGKSSGGRGTKHTDE